MENLLQRYKELGLGIICSIFALMYLIGSGMIHPLIETPFDARVMPRILGTLLLVVGLLQIEKGIRVAKHWTGEEKEEGEPGEIEPEKKDFKYVWMMFLVILVYVLVLSTVGFLISTFVVMFLQMLILAPNNKIKVGRFLLLSALFTAAIYVLFRYGLQLILPMGWLG